VGNSNFKKFINEYFDDTLKNTDMIRKRPEAMPYIEKLIKFDWSNGKKLQRESAICFSKLAESDDKISNKFLKEVDRFCSGLKKKYIKEGSYKFQLFK